MKLYKYVSLEDIQHIEWLEDIIKKNRLFCQTYLYMNDPMDAYFDFEPLSEDNRERDKEVRLDMSKMRARTVMCSLSKTAPTEKAALLMWVHYAKTFKGACLEVEVSEQEGWTGFDVEYVGALKKVQNDIDDFTSCFKQKLSPWQYERESRFIKTLDSKRDIGTDNYLNIKLTKITLGYNVSDTILQGIRKMVRKYQKVSVCDKVIGIPDTEFVCRLTKTAVMQIMISD